MVTLDFAKSCRRDRINPTTPAFAAEYRYRGGVSRKAAAEDVRTIWHFLSGFLAK
jgi:hypothetical protein